MNTTKEISRLPYILNSLAFLEKYESQEELLLLYSEFVY